MNMTGPLAHRGRLAPSPTGLLHLGNAYAFLTAWLRARSRGGSLVLRMEDIDPERSKPAFVRAIYADLDWLGLECDEGPIRGGPRGPYEQSGRLESYGRLLDDLSRKGLAYSCYCSRKELRMLASAPHFGDEGAPYPGTCRTLTDAEHRDREAAGRRPSLRLNTNAALRHAFASCPSPDELVLHPDSATAGGRHDGWPGPSARVGGSTGEDACLSFSDAVRGTQRFLLRDCGGDFALWRSDGVVAYQLAVVADDAAMGITEVVRGDDLLLSTLRQLLLFRLLGRPAPEYAHIPLLHDATGERLAKRHQSLTLASLREAGASPEAVVGYLGWLAGFQERPVPARAGDLLAGFSLDPLCGRYLQLPEDAARFIIGMRGHRGMH